MTVNEQAHWDRLANAPRSTLTDLFAQDPTRVAKLTGLIDVGHGSGFIHFDWSKTHLTDALLSGFEALATEMDFGAKRAAMLSGQKVNRSEHRAATHAAERGIGSPTDVEAASSLHHRMRMLVAALHQGSRGTFRHLIHIGIGGSALGPALAIDALARGKTLIDVHVVSNVDGCALEQAFAACDPATTLVAIASKTFTTIETMTNARSALDWLARNSVADPISRVVAITAQPHNAEKWGVQDDSILSFPESVGGRYSLWSSIGFPVAMAIGWDGFSAMLAGGRAMDQHFGSSDGRDNLPLRAAFADQLYSRLRGCQTRACFAYDERLSLLPAYLQQLEMESNGKRVRADGREVSGPTAPITWGGVGTDAQHAVFQLLHQGTHIVPVDFIASIAAGDSLDSAHHRILLMNCFAQGAALMAGQQSEDPARVYPGDRPSTTILCDVLDPPTVGALIAFHEHRTFANALLMGINPFDQFGVELGKDIAGRIAAGGQRFDASTEKLLEIAALSDYSGTSSERANALT